MRTANAKSGTQWKGAFEMGHSFLYFFWLVHISESSKSSATADQAVVPGALPLTLSRRVSIKSPGSFSDDRDDKSSEKHDYHNAGKPLLHKTTTVKRQQPGARILHHSVSSAQ